MSAQTFDNFVSGSYAALTPNLAADTCVNLYYESAETGTGKNRAALMGAPGLAQFTQLPTQPVRGILVGEDLLFVVAGAIYYQVFADGTYQARGNVGNDGNPVQMFENGTQVLIISAGYAYCDGGGPGGATNPVDWADQAGICNTSGTTVTLVSGGNPDVGDTNGIFPPDAAGFDIVIHGVVYTIASITNSTTLVLTSSAGIQTGVQYFGAGGSVPCYYQNGTGTVDTSGTAVTWDSGATFDSSNVGNQFIINGVYYTVASVTDSTHLVLSSSAGIQSGVNYASNYQVAASCGAYLDQYYIVAQPGKRTFNISAIDDGKSWNPIDYGVKEAYGDGIQFLLVDHEQLWIYGDKTSEVWYNSGAANFPFQRIPGAMVMMGDAGPFSPASVAGTVAWLGGDARGRTVAYAADGFSPSRISTHAVETAWAQGAVGDATTFAYTDDGHDFWVVTFPSQDKTWVYDFTEKLWHQRGWWDGTALHRTRYQFHGFVFDEHVVSDWETGQLYYMSTSNYDDVGQPIYHERASPHVSPPMLMLAQQGNSAGSPFENNLTFYHRFLLDMEAGTGSGTVASDVFVTSWTGQTSVIVAHNLGVMAVCVEVFDSTGLVEGPESVTIIDANRLLLTFGDFFSGTCVVIKSTPAKLNGFSYSFVAQTTVTLYHRLGTEAVIVQCYDATNLQIKPETVTVIDTNTVQLTFGAAVSGTGIVIAGSYSAAWTAETAVIATHDLGTTAVEVQCYSAGGLQVGPEAMQVTGVNTVSLKFGAAFSGYVVVFASVDATQPFIILDWSDDGGHTFGVAHTTGTGLPGAYSTRVLWRRLGKSRDRVFRVRYLCRGKVAFINAYLESTAGSA